jgi:hypothetical protein
MENRIGGATSSRGVCEEDVMVRERIDGKRGWAEDWGVGYIDYS